MNADPRGDDLVDPGDDAVAAAFAAYRAEAPASFEPRPVDELLMSGPAALRRRRLLSLAAVVGACTAVTAGGFAVAQTIGSLPKEPERDSQAAVVQESSSSERSPGTPPGAPEAPHSEGEDATSEHTQTPGLDGPIVLVEEWDGHCDGGAFGVDLDSWEFTDETDWAILAHEGGDVDGDGESETLLVLACGDRTAVAAFEPHEGGLDHFGWVWRQPDSSQEFSEIADIDDGLITLQGIGDASETWTARYLWDGESFVTVDDEPSTAPSTSDPATTPDSGETQTTSVPPAEEDQVS